jgi:hypothetical protein
LANPIDGNPESILPAERILSQNNEKKQLERTMFGIVVATMPEARSI